MFSSRMENIDLGLPRRPFEYVNEIIWVLIPNNNVLTAQGIQCAMAARCARPST